MYTKTQRQLTELPCMDCDTAGKQAQPDRLSIKSNTSFELTSAAGAGNANPFLMGILALVSGWVILTPFMMLLFLMWQGGSCQPPSCPNSNPPAIILEQESKQESLRLELPTAEQ